jgi:hypothetical protein
MKPLAQFALIAAWGLTLALTGCVSTHNLAGNLTPDGRATLQGDDHVQLWKIDDQWGPNRLGFGSSWDGSYKVDLTPGPHTLMLQCQFFVFRVLGFREMVGPRSSVQMVAQSGHTYTLVAERNKERWTILLNDQAPGTNVVSVNVAEGNLVKALY